MTPPPAAAVPASLFAAIVAAAVAGAAVVMALRGRRVDDHPLCRKCGFDLFGKPKGSTRCPECGAGLHARRAVRVGHRRRRGRLLAVALPVLLVAAGWLGLLGWGRATGVDWNRHKPVWWLVREADSPTQGTRDAALAELVRRTAAGRLTDDQIAALTDKALAYQADAGRPWVPAWGDVVERARAAGRLPDEKWRRYARQAARSGLRLWARPVVRRGCAPSVQVRVTDVRMGAARFRVEWLGERPDQVSGRSLGRPPPSPGNWCYLDRATRHVCGGEDVALDESVWANLADGPQTFRVALAVRLFESPDDDNAKPLVEETVPLTAAWDLVPADAPPVHVRTDPALAEAVGRSVAVASVGPLSPPRGVYRVRLDVTRPPVALVMRASLRWDGVERPASRPFVARAGEVNSIPLSVNAPDELPDRVDVVLRPDFERDYEFADVAEAWGEVFVLPGVKVTIPLPDATGAVDRPVGQ